MALTHAELIDSLTGLGFTRGRPSTVMHGRFRVDDDVPGRHGLEPARQVILHIRIDLATGGVTTEVIDGAGGAPVAYMDMPCAQQIAEAIDDVVTTVEVGAGLSIDHRHPDRTP